MRIRNNISFDDYISLVKLSSTPTYDEYGNQTFEESQADVMCNVSSVDRNQFYSAGNRGYKLSYIFTINGFEYSDEEIVIYNKNRYEVVRSYELDNGLTELTIGERIGDRNVSNTEE